MLSSPWSLLQLLLLLLQLLSLLPNHFVGAVHFQLGQAYIYRVTSAAHSDADVEKTILSAGGSPAQATDTQGRTSYVFNADIEVAPYDVTADGTTLCKVSFLNTPELVLGTAGTDYHHDSTGSFDFHSNFFGFSLGANGVVKNVLYHLGDDARVLQIKRGIASLFSAPVNHPETGPKRRSFTEIEPGQFGEELGSYDVNLQGENIVYTRRSSLARRGTADDTKIDHSSEKTLVKAASSGHFVSIQLNDVVSLKGTVGTVEKGLKRRDQDVSPSWDLLMTTTGSSRTVFIRNGTAFHVDGPPAGIQAGPLFPPPQKHYQPLQHVMSVVRTSLKCFDHSVVDSNLQTTPGQKAACFAKARTALATLSPSDALVAANYLMLRSNLASGLWIGFELVGEMCASTPELLDHMLREAFNQPIASDEDIEKARFALQAGFKCIEPTDEAVQTLKSISANHTLPGVPGVVASALVDQAYLLLGYLGRQLFEQGRINEATEVTKNLVAALEHPTAKLSPRSYQIPDFGEGDANEHVHEESMISSEAAARRATLINALGHTRDISIVPVLRSAALDLDTPVDYHPVVRVAALNALGQLSGREVEDTLLATLTSVEHAPLHQDALTALKARDREMDLADIGKGAEELRELYKDSEIHEGPLTVRALRARGLVEITLDKTSPVADRSIDIRLAAPALSWDNTFGAKIVGVRAQLRAINQVRLFLSILESHFDLEINNVALAALYFDIGGYNEIEIFKAKLLLSGSLSYNMHMGNFKMSDVTRLDEIFKGWIETLKNEFEDIKTALPIYWGYVQSNVTMLETAVNGAIRTDWTGLLQSFKTASLDDDVMVILDLFSELQTNIVDFGKNVTATIITTARQTVNTLTLAINDLVGASLNFLECPEQAVAAVLNSVELIRDTADSLKDTFNDLLAMFSLDTLDGLLPDIDDEFSDYVNTTLATYPELANLSKLANNFIQIKDTLEDAVQSLMKTYTDFRSGLREVMVYYNKLKGLFDATFGPKAHSDFPNVAASPFPAENWSDGARAYQGMGLKTTVQQSIVAPFAGSLDRVDATTVCITVTESSLKKHLVYISNLIPTAKIGKVKKGDKIGTARESSIKFIIYDSLIAKKSVDPLK
ncbi:hypothetical protein HDU86_007627 [Geranomyces michiganensis]|nr:hypothetical protein HDU86_007627 [Geranomyces michiganensis]